MTVSELYNSTAQLGFEDSIEYEDGFVFATNRAILQLAALRPEVRCVTVNHSPLENLIIGADFAPILRSEDLTFEAAGARSYYFEVCGSGIVYIERKRADGEWEYIGDNFSFDTKEYTAYKGFIKADGEFVNDTVRIRFGGEFAYNVRFVAMYEHIFSLSAEDIPAYTPYTPYDISGLASDFLSLGMPPIKEEDGYEYLSCGYDIENGRILLLPYSSPGVYKVLYNHAPQKIADDGAPSTNEEVIDLDEEICALLPLLVAAYIWMDDEPEKAQYYLSLYRERAADFESRVRNVRPAVIRDVYGW